MNPGHRAAPVLIAFAVTIAVLASLAPIALAQDQQYGFDDTAAGGGMGVKFTPAESTQISNTLDKIADLEVIVLKDQSAVDPAEIAKDLREMLKDGRMGKGEGAKEKVNASTHRDGKETTAGDRMNVSDHLLKSASNEQLADVLAHEWKHAKQAGGTQPEREAAGYQVGGAMYLTKGGGLDDDPLKNDSFQVKKFKAQIAEELKKQRDGKTPAEGSDHCDCAENGGVYLFSEPTSKLFLWAGGERRDSLAALPGRMFFSVHHLKTRGAQAWVLVTGTDTTNALAPVGVATLLQADATHFLSRTDVVLSSLRYPFAAASSSDRHRVYLLDTQATGPAVWVYQDFSGDSIPDQVLPIPFATAPTPGVSSALGILPGTLAGFPEGVLLTPLDLRGVDELTPSEPMRLLIDLNGDALADASTPALYAQFVRFAPTIANRPVAGSTLIEVYGMDGHLVELRSTDPTGTVDYGVIGSMVFVGYVPAAMPLNRPLAAGEHILAVDVTDNSSAAAPEEVIGLPPGPLPAAGAPGLGILGLLLVGFGGGALSGWGGRRAVCPGDRPCRS